MVSKRMSGEGESRGNRLTQVGFKLMHACEYCEKFVSDLYYYRESKSVFLSYSNSVVSHH